MIYGVLENDKLGRVGDVKTKSHFRAIVKYLISPAAEEHDQSLKHTRDDRERVVYIENAFSLKQSCNPSDKEQIKDFTNKVCDSYDTFIQEVRQGKKPPKTLFKHNVLSFSHDEMEALKDNLKKKYPAISESQIKEKQTDFLRMLAISGLENHMGTDRQYLIVIHGEKDHLHAHIVANTVDYKGKVFSKRREDLYNQEWCQKIQKKYPFLADLQYKTVAEYEKTEEQKQELESKVFKERQEKKNAFIKDCNRISVNYSDILQEIREKMSDITKKEEIKPDHFIKAFSSIDKPFQIQPIFHVKKSKVTGLSFKIFYEGYEITLKSSLLDEEHHLKSFKDRLVDYRYHRNEYAALDSFLDFTKQFYSNDAVTLFNKIDNNLKQEWKPETYKSRYLEFNGEGFQFKNGFGRLKDKTLMTVNQSDIAIHESNAITIKEAVRIAKEKGWTTIGVDTKNEQLAQIYFDEAERLGLGIHFDNEKFEDKFQNIRKNRPQLKPRINKKKDE